MGIGKSKSFSVTQSKASDAAPASQAASLPPDEDLEPNRLTLICWNIAGFQKDCTPRVENICDTINIYRPDVVLLQEVTQDNQKQIEKLCPYYRLVPGGRTRYYTAILCHVHRLIVNEYHVTAFPTTCLDRNLLTVQATVKNLDVTVMTSHLESPLEYKDTTEERKKQLRQCFDAMLTANDTHCVIFGGDLNILNPNEISDMGGIPDDITDTWEATGSDPETEITFDMLKNDNVEFKEDQPQRRLDRIYLRQPKEGAQHLQPAEFTLIGTERLQGCEKFPSDHWGIFSSYDIVN